MSAERFAVLMVGLIALAVGTVVCRVLDTPPARPATPTPTIPVVTLVPPPVLVAPTATVVPEPTENVLVPTATMTVTSLPAVTYTPIPPLVLPAEPTLTPTVTRVPVQRG